MVEPALPDKIVALHHALAGARIAHAFGGALALAYYAEPRATIDIDVNLFVATGRRAEVEAVFASLGVAGAIDPDALARDGQFRVRWGRTPIDLFFAYDPIHDAMRDATRRVPFGDTKIPILAPEYLVVCKAVFDRPKDWLDIEQVLVCAETIDRDEIALWLERLVGAGDHRAEQFARLADELLGM